MYLILDIGGTHTRVGLVNDEYKLLETAFLATSAKYSEGLTNIFKFVESKDQRITKVCAGIAGVTYKGTLHSSPNLKGWIGKPIINDLNKEFRCEVVVENDAALAGLGEAVYGAGKDYKIIAYLTIGTGVGGARIVNKRIDEKVYGFEPGQYLTNAIAIAIKPRCERISPLRCTTFESFVSGSSIKKAFGMSAENITDEKSWEQIIKNITVGVANTVYFWSPEAIILGGGVSHSDYFDISLLRKEVKRILKKTYPSIPEIKKAVLGDFSGIWGGVAYLSTVSE